MSHITQHIKTKRSITITGISAIFILLLLTLSTLLPLDWSENITEAVTGSATLSETSLTMTSSSTTASVDLSVNKDNGTFASSTNPIAFSITTNNYTGYTLSLSGTSSNLTNNIRNGNSTETSPIYSTLSSISSAVSSDTFSADSTSAGNNYNGKFGILPSKYNSAANSSYLPAPTNTITLDKTTTPNSAANGYTIGLGARASYTQPAGTYTGTYTITAVGNAITYYLAFADNTSDSTVSGLPNALTGSISTTSVTLPTTTPTRTGYIFKSWCLGTVSNNGTTCTGTEYTKGASFGIDQTSSNGNSTTPVTLYALWTVNSNNVTLTRGNNITNITLGSGSTTNSSTTSSFNYGSTVTMSATKASNTTCITYGTPSWTVTSGGVTLSTTSGTSASFTMPNNAVAVTVSSSSTRKTYSIAYKPNGGTGSMDNTTAYCGSSTALRDNTFIRFGYTFLGWSTSSNAANATYTDGQSVTLERTSTLTLYAVWGEMSIADATYMQDVTTSMVSDMGSNDTKTLTDYRDGQIYTTAKIGSLLWMTRNLAIGCNGSGSTYGNTVTSIELISSDSNVSSAWSTPTTGLTSGNSYSDPRIACHVTYGAYYNYAAASAGTTTGTSNSGVTSYSVCPKGWRLPNFTETQTLGSSRGSVMHVATFNPARSGRYVDGSLTAGSGGLWWSSADISAASRHYLYYDYNNDKLYTGSDYGYNRYYGLSVRCVHP